MRDLSAPDFSSRAVQTCPFDAYETARRTGPVFFETETGFYHVLDYRHVRALASDARRLSNRAGVMTEKAGDDQRAVDAIVREHGMRIIPVLVEDDDPDHGFHRALVNNAFFPERVRSIEPFIVDLTDRLIDAFIGKDEVDLMSEFAIILPMSVIADQLGVPAADLPLFKRWSDARVARAEPGISRERLLALTRDYCRLQMYVDERAARYRAEPGDCILSDLVHADVDGRRLTREEITAIATVLIVAGNETTTTAICHAMLRIATDPPLQARLRAEPALLPQFIEEVLRLDAPLQSLFRRATVDIDVDGFVIPAGSVVVLKWGAANRDAAKFARPDSLDLARSNTRQHLTFGYGPHSCIGNQLARSEMRLALTALLARAGNWRVAPGDSVVRHPHYFAYGYKSLRLAFDPT